jgi:proteasome beta subunit
MALPLFPIDRDPGASFVGLIRALGVEPYVVPASIAAQLPIAHATTCVALRYADGVLFAGDRRATAGHLISHRDMEKVVQADRWSAVAIAGAAGPAMQMIKIFQLQLEHYEKMIGRDLTLEGKANSLSTMVRDNLGAAMQGLAVVPIFGGFEPADGTGRLWDFDITGGRYEERDYVATGSGSLHAGTVIKVGWRRDMSRSDAIELACRAMWEAADADSATGGPDELRGIYPIVATVTAEGWTRTEDAELRDVFRSIAEELSAR